MAASMCGTMPMVQAKAARMLARAPRARPAAIVYSAPVPGVATTTRVVNQNSGLISREPTARGQRRLSDRITLLKVSVQEQPFAWRSIILPVFLPAILFGLGEGAIIPIIPLVAENLGGSLAIAGLVAALLTIGELFGSPPAGWIVSRIGERAAMIGASGFSSWG